MEATYENYSFELTALLTLKTAFEPYMIIGFDFTDLTVKDGSSMSGITGDAIYHGVGISYGPGAVFRIGSSFLLDIGIVSRFQFYGSMKGISGIDKKIYNSEDDINIVGKSYILRLSYVF